jgi:signal transduction histidine kinase
MTQLRELARGIYPAQLENEGLGGALGQAVNRVAIPATLECDGVGHYPREIEAAVYFCCLEALQNSAKHAGEAARARVTLAARDDALFFAVIDDGRGFDPSGVDSESSGLQNMTDRIGALGGTLRIDSGPSRGTTVSGRLPLSPPL